MLLTSCKGFIRCCQKGACNCGLCTRTQGLNKSQNKGHVQSDQAAAYLLHGRSAYWRTAFPFAQKTYRKQCSGYVYDAGYAALLYAGYVRKAWTAPGKDRGQHSQSSCDPSKAATLPDQQLLCRINTVQLQDWDGRYSRRNKEWAKTIPNDNPETVRCGYALNSHPAVLDGFIDLVREEQQRSRTQREKLEPSRPSVRDKLKQELPANKSAAPKKRELER